MYSMEGNLRLKNFARASIIAIDGVVPGWTLLGGRYGTLKTRASVLELRGARRIA